MNRLLQNQTCLHRRVSEIHQMLKESQVLLDQMVSAEVKAARPKSPTYAEDTVPQSTPFKEKESEFKRDSPYAQ